MKKLTTIMAHRLDEMSLMNRPNDGISKATKIYVYGENDKQGIKTPHFHVIIDNGKVEYEIEFKNIYRMSIWRTKHNAPLSWDGYTNVRDDIISWLNKIGSKNRGLTNLERMIMAWNDNNPDNEIDDDYVKG